MKVEYFKVNETNKKEIVEIVANLDGKKTTLKGANVYAWKKSSAYVYTRTEVPSVGDDVLIVSSGKISKGSVSAYDESDGITVSSETYARDSADDVTF